MNIDNPSAQAIDLVLFAVIYPALLCTSFGMFAKFLYAPFCIFINAIWSRGRKMFSRKVYIGEQS